MAQFKRFIKKSRILENRLQRFQLLTGKRKQINVDTRIPIFHLPTHNGANKSIGKWAHRAGIDKYITWHSARLSFSILLQDANVDTATVALLLGHTSTRYVNEVYKRHRPKNQAEHIQKLPAVEWIYN
ncbi:MAG: tyrosine-type recombinase/integrase [Chitinophagaceae bacterium]|nr:tyrosine-type recombinase/integrase [Chitinophagaceae bacterium]